MVPHITCQTIFVPATGTHGVKQGLLIFADNTLMAVIMHLENGAEEDRKGRWFLETGYGPCTPPIGTDLTFRSPDEAQQWVLKRMTSAGAN
jgi:hypothetical protein